MKGNELMLGDWIILNYEGVRKVVRIIRLHQYYADVMTENDTEIQRVAYSMLEGMELTEEILKANGFERNTLHYNDNNVVYYNPITSYLQIYSLIDDYQKPKINLYIGNVHELQHSLILCKLNELAYNFKIK